jgi:hypothetical protein
MKTSARPWKMLPKYSETKTYGGDAIYIEDANCQTVCICYGPNSEKNAKAIVEAINNTGTW